MHTHSPISEFPDNPVVTRDFLLTHKAEILCGPVTVNRYVDLTGQAANLTLTSPALFACKGRSFLIHIKAIRPNEDEEEVFKFSFLDFGKCYLYKFIF